MIGPGSRLKNFLTELATTWTLTSSSTRLNPDNVSPVPLNAETYAFLISSKRHSFIRNTFRVQLADPLNDQSILVYCVQLQYRDRILTDTFM